MKNEHLNLNVFRENKEKYIKRTIPINNNCNNNCLFCFAHYNKKNDNNENSKFVFSEIKKSAEQGVNFLALSGYGEPTLSKNLKKYITYAKKMGILHIGLTSNGRMLKNEKYLKELVSLGLNSLFISIHSDQEKIHDLLTRAPGSFRQTIEGIKNAVRLKEKYNLKITLDVVINRYNYKRIMQITKFLDNLGADIIHIARFIPVGNAHTYYEDLKVNSEEMAPFLKKLVSRKYKSKITLLFPLKEIYFIKNMEDYITITGFKDKSFLDIARSICKHHRNKEIYNKTFPECKECNLELICKDLSKMQQNINNNNFKEIFVEVKKPEDLNFKDNRPTKIILKTFSEEIVNSILKKKFKDKLIIEISSKKYEYLQIFLKKADIIIKSEEKTLDLLKKIKNLNKGKITIEIVLNKENIRNLKDPNYRKELLNLSNNKKIILRFKLDNLVLRKFFLNIYETKEFIENLFVEKMKYPNIEIINIPFCYLDKKIHKFIKQTSFVSSYSPQNMNLINKTFNINYFFEMFNKEARTKKRICQKCSMNDNCLGEFINYVREHGFNKKILN